MWPSPTDITVEWPSREFHEFPTTITINSGILRLHGPAFAAFIERKGMPLSRKGEIDILPRAKLVWG